MEDPSFTEQVENLLTQIRDFNAECEDAQHTDTAIAWDILRNVRDTLNALMENEPETY